MAHTPLQKRVILGLESGIKLHILLCEPGMPRKDMVDEWRNNPEFEVDYVKAAEKGKQHRLARGIVDKTSVEPEQRRPAVLRENTFAPQKARPAPAALLVEDTNDVVPPPETFWHNPDPNYTPQKKESRGRPPRTPVAKPSTTESVLEQHYLVFPLAKTLITNELSQAMEAAKSHSLNEGCTYLVVEVAGTTRLCSVDISVK